MDDAVAARPQGGYAPPGAEFAPAARPTVADVLKGYGASLHTLFTASADPMSRFDAPGPPETDPFRDVRPPDLAYKRVHAPDDALDELSRRLRGAVGVLASYVKPAAEPAVNTMRATTVPPAGMTPNFNGRQEYLAAAPEGIDASYAWQRPGGRGAGVSVCDVEGSWRTTHEDLTGRCSVIFGQPSPDLGWRNHGSAVVGVIAAADNGLGVTGIAPETAVSLVSIFATAGTASAVAIRQAANSLKPGDILLVELHWPGPRHDYAPRTDQAGYIAIEWWPDDFDSIRYAVERGVIVVEAAGNGGEDLDADLYDKPQEGFASDWRSPFDRTVRDSGAVIVGAGAPPQGTHGRDLYGPDRSRLAFSNCGSVVDAQGWGREVTTCGYGDLQGGPDEDVWYTDSFSGTSSASPVVVGALACLQGCVHKAGLPGLTPTRARDLLRTTGSPQQDAPGRPASQRIGSRPDLSSTLSNHAA